MPHALCLLCLILKSADTYFGRTVVGMYILILFKDFLISLFRRYRIYSKFHVVCPATSVMIGEMVIGKQFGLSPDCQILCQDPKNGSQLIIGDNVSLNYGVMINADGGGKIKIGNNVLIGPKTTIRDRKSTRLNSSH